MLLARSIEFEVLNYEYRLALFVSVCVPVVYADIGFGARLLFYMITLEYSR